MSVLADLRDLVEEDLNDTGNAIWSTDQIDRAIQRALGDYSRVSPQRAVGTVTLAADGREVSLASLTGLLRVVKVWYPYTVAEPEDPPEWRIWGRWGGTLRIVDGDEPVNGGIVRVYYFKGHTIEDLDAAAATTVPVDDEEVILTGASAYAALQAGRSSVGEAGVSTKTPEQWLQWATARMRDFQGMLEAVRKRETRAVDKRVPLEGGWEREAGNRGGI